jgi:hypothetical protein
VNRTLIGQGLAVVAAAGLVAGCGSGSSTAGPQAAPTTPTTSAPSGTAGGGPPGHPTAATIANCRSAVAARTGFSATLKTQLAELCEKAATENPVQLRATAAAVCTELVNSSALPAGAEKNQALAACKAA